MPERTRPTPSTEDRLVIKQDLDQLQLTVGAPWLNNAVLAYGVLIFVVAALGFSILAQLTTIWLVSTPLLCALCLLLALAAPLTLLLGRYLGRWLYEVTISTRQLSLQAGNLFSLTIPLDRVVDCQAEGDWLHLDYRSTGGRSVRRSMRAAEVPVEDIARLVREATVSAPLSGSQDDVPTQLAALRRKDREKR